MARVKVTGALDIERALLALSRTEARKIGRAAIRKAARQIELAAEANVPVRTGTLKKAVQVKVDQGRDKSFLFANIRIKKGPPRPRKTNRKSRIKGKLAEARYGYQIGTQPEVYGAFVEFGAPGNGVAPQPFMRPAWDSDGGNVALGRIGKELGDGIEKAAAAGKFRR